MSICLIFKDEANTVRRYIKTYFLGSLIIFLTLIPTAEQRLRVTADERRREYNEERRNEYENYVEEERDGKTSVKRHSVPSFFSWPCLP